MRALRSALFYVGYVIVTVIWATLSLAFAWPLSHKGRFDFIVGRWTRMALWWLRVTCGVRVRARGLERIPRPPCIFLVKHQSAWETLWMQTVASPQATLVKRELLRIPFWGWAFGLARPIAIDRGNRREALRQFMAQGKDRLQRGMFVTLFPEGTRVAEGAVGKFHKSGAALAASTGAPVVVVAHNAGRFWPRGFLKRPGTISAEFSEPLRTQGKSPAEINKLCETWLREAMQRLDRSTDREKER